MSVEEKIARIKAKAAKVAVKVATLATLATGVGAVSGCVETNDRNTDENKDKIENVNVQEDKIENVNVQEDKTSVVFRATHNSSKYGKSTDILLENGESFKAYGPDNEGTFIEPGDTITYGPKKYDYDLGNSVVRTGIKAVRYKDGAEKDVNFGKIGKLEEGR